MIFFCSDLEGVWVPEVWISVARITGIDELKLTTRDISDYNVLMNHRISILKKHNIKLKDIQNVIAQIEPLPGALETLNWIREKSQITIVSDTFVEFADPLMAQLNRPLLFCNYLTIDENGMVADYNLRQPDQKREVVKALQQLKYTVIAFGDSYNDISMLQQAEQGILFRPPLKVVEDYPQFPVVTEYDDLRKMIGNYM